MIECQLTCQKSVAECDFGVSSRSPEQILSAPPPSLRRSEIRIPNQSENRMKSAVQSERGGREGGGVVGARARTHAIRGGRGGGKGKKKMKTLL